MRQSIEIETLAEQQGMTRLRTERADGRADCLCFTSRKQTLIELLIQIGHDHPFQRFRSSYYPRGLPIGRLEMRRPIGVTGNGEGGHSAQARIKAVDGQVDMNC